jgi:hypothetical protein
VVQKYAKKALNPKKFAYFFVFLAEKARLLKKYAYLCTRKACFCASPLSE